MAAGGMLLAVGAALSPPRLAVAQADKQETPPLVSVQVKDADVRETLTTVFKQAKIENYVIAPEVRGELTLSLKSKPLDAVLNLIARVSSPPLAWSKTDGVYAVRVRTEKRRTSDNEEAAAPDPATPDAIALGDGTRVEVIRLMFADAQTVAAALGVIRPPDLQAAAAYVPNNQLITRWGPGAGANGFASGAFGSPFGNPLGIGNGFGRRPGTPFPGSPVESGGMGPSVPRPGDAPSQR